MCMSLNCAGLVFCMRCLKVLRMCTKTKLMCRMGCSWEMNSAVGLLAWFITAVCMDTKWYDGPQALLMCL